MSNFENYKRRSIAIRKKHHELKQLHHRSEWTIEEDALVFLTDAGLVGQNTMSHQKRWPKEDTQTELEHKLWSVCSGW